MQSREGLLPRVAHQRGEAARLKQDLDHARDALLIFDDEDGGPWTSHPNRQCGHAVPPDTITRLLKLGVPSTSPLPAQDAAASPVRLLARVNDPIIRNWPRSLEEEMAPGEGCHCLAFSHTL